MKHVGSSDRRQSSNVASSQHRMPTISAAQALQDLRCSSTRFISTSISQLDCLLQNSDGSLNSSDIVGGVSRGTVTEIYGPPGVGKTAVGMQLAVNALKASDGVVWVDAAHPLCGTRLFQILTSPKTAQLPNASPPPQYRSDAETLDLLTHFSTPTLAHLVALISRITDDHPPINTSLMIIDSLSTLIANAFPRTIDAKSTPKKPAAPNAPSRKFPVLQYLINILQKIAVTRNIAIVVLSQCVSKMQHRSGAILVPSINTTAWEHGLGARIVLFRDWSWNDEDGNSIGDVRWAQVLKANGLTIPEGKKALTAFAIHESGLSPLELPNTSTSQFAHQAIYQMPSNNSQQIASLQELVGQKRKIRETDLEIPDSDGEDDEDYGWAEEDEEDVPPMPPQWQGSEDILLAGVGELESEKGEEEEREAEWERDKDGLLDVEGSMKFRGGEPMSAQVIDDSEDELA